MEDKINKAINESTEVEPKKTTRNEGEILEEILLLSRAMTRSLSYIRREFNPPGILNRLFWENLAKSDIGGTFGNLFTLSEALGSRQKVSNIKEQIEEEDSTKKNQD